MLEKEDLNRKILKNSKSKKTAQKIFFSRTIITFLVIAIQLAILVYFLLRLNNQMEIYFGFSIVISSIFMIYLSNCDCKNEYKIAWITLVIVFPVVGISCYWIYHLDAGARKLKKEIIKIKNDINEIYPPAIEDKRILEKQANREFEGLISYLNSEGGFKSYNHTKTEYFPNGETFFPQLLESLKAAKKYIFIEFFIITVDESWEQIVDILEQKVKEGVEVRVICDGVGTYMITGKLYQDYLKEKGIKSKVFNPVPPFISTPINNRDHRKIVVIDGNIGFTGGVNLSNQYFNVGENHFAYWKDNAVKLTGDAVKNLLQMFLTVWNIGEKTKDDYGAFLNEKVPEQKEDGIIVPYGDDAFNDEDIAENIYLEIINKAEKYLYITSPYIVIDNQMLSALIFAAKKGVDVRVVVPSQPDHLVTFCIGKTYLKNLIDGGVKVYLYNKGFIHAKTFLADDVIGTVGSVNMDYRSFYAHFECGALLCRNSILKDIKIDFESMFVNDCVEMKVEDYKKIPVYQRMIGRVLRIFGPVA